MMSPKDKFKTSLSLCRNSNHKVLYSLIMIICATLTMLVLTITTNYIKIEKANMATPEYRTLFAGPVKEEFRQKILCMEHVIDVYEYDNTINVNVDIDGQSKEITLKRLKSQDLPRIIHGEKYKDGDSNTIVCSEPFYTNEAYKNRDKKDRTSFKSNLNKEIDISYYDYKLEGKEEKANELHHEKLKVVGLYKRGATSNESACYINTTDFERIRDIQHSEDIEAKRKTLGHNYYSVVVDKKSNVDKVSNELIKMSTITGGVAIGSDFSTMAILLAIAIIILVILIFIVVMMTKSYTKKRKASEEKEIKNMLKENTEKDVSQTYALSMAIQNTFIYIIGLVIFHIIIAIALNKISVLTDFEMYINLILSAFDYIILFIIIVIIPSTIFYSKIVNKKE